MYDCSETIAQENTTQALGKPASRPFPTRAFDRPTGMTLNAKPFSHHGPAAVNDLLLNKRYPGQSWVRFCSHSVDDEHLLAQVQALAPQIKAAAILLDDGSLLLRQLSLEQILALSARFGGRLSVSAHIAGTGQHV